MSFHSDPAEPARPKGPKQGKVSMKKELKIWGIASAVVLALSVIMPWISAMGTSVNLVSGDGGSDGLILLGMAAVFAVTFALWPEGTWSRIVAFINAGIGLYESIHIHMAVTDAKAEAGGFGVLVSVGFGAYVCMLAALSLLSWACYLTYQDIQARRAQRSRLVNGAWVRGPEQPENG